MRSDLEAGLGVAPHTDGAAQDRTALGRIAVRIMAARGWKRAGLGWAAGAASALAFAPFFLWPVLFATLPVLVWMIEGAGREPRPMRAAAIAAWWFGFGMLFVGLLWIGEAFLVEADIFAWLMPFAVTLLPAYLAAYYALAGAAAQGLTARLLSDRSGGSRVPSPAADIIRCLLLAACIGVGEWLRGHCFTGFPWDVLGVALTYPLALMQADGVLGIYGMTLWTVFLCALPLVVLARATPPQLPRAGVLVAGLAGVPLAVAYALGSWHLAQPPSPPLPGVKVRIVQPSVPQRDKWSSEKQPGIFADHIDLSKRDGRGHVDDLAGVTVLIWPEASMPFGPLAHPEALTAIGRMLPSGVRLLAGGLRQEQDEATGTRRFYNSLMVFGADGSLEQLYDKVHLVPFGEYLPYQSVLEAIGLQSLTRQRGGFSSGPLPRQPLTVAGLPLIAPLICYEAIFPDEAAVVGPRAGLAVVVTNDGWFGNSTGPPQHFHQTRLRAVEQGITILRAANNGISAVIDPEGRVTASLALNARGSIDSVVPSARPKPWYARWGDGLFVFNVLGFAVAAAAIRRLPGSADIYVGRTPG